MARKSKLSLGRLLVAGVAAAAMAVVALPAEAAPRAKTSKVAASQPQGGEVVVKVGRDGKKTVYVPRIIIHGKIQRPNVNYILERAKADYSWVLPKRSFTKEIVKATSRGPF